MSNLIPWGRCGNGAQSREAGAGPSEAAAKGAASAAVHVSWGGGPLLAQHDNPNEQRTVTVQYCTVLQVPGW